MGKMDGRTYGEHGWMDEEGRGMGKVEGEEMDGKDRWTDRERLKDGWGRQRDGKYDGKGRQTDGEDGRTDG